MAETRRSTNTAYGPQTCTWSRVLLPVNVFTAIFRYGLDAKGLGVTHFNHTRDFIGGLTQSGALFSFKNNPETVIIRAGISFKSVDQACSNAENEIGSTPFEAIIAQSKAQWNEKLSRIELDLANTPRNVTEMFYSSFYRSFLTPVS